MQKCKLAEKYKAERPPKCDNGRGCDHCRQKWEARNQAAVRKARSTW